MRNFINKFAWYLVKKTCNHKKEKEVFIDYQDNFIETKCKKCKSKFYRELL